VEAQQTSTFLGHQEPKGEKERKKTKKRGRGGGKNESGGCQEQCMRLEALELHEKAKENGKKGRLCHTKKPSAKGDARISSDEELPGLGWKNYYADISAPLLNPKNQLKGLVSGLSYGEDGSVCRETSPGVGERQGRGSKEFL